MSISDKIKILVYNFKKKHGYNPTCVLLPEVTQGKFLGLLVKQGERLGVGVGTKLMFWSENLDMPESEKSVFELIVNYQNRQTGLKNVLDAIVDFEQLQRTNS